MLRTYLFERTLNLLYRQGKISGGLYTGRGNEAVAVGASSVLEEGDTMAPSHRGIGAHFVRGETFRGMMLQILARAEGGTKGRDNSAHQGSMERGVLALISHLATMPSLSAGCALAHQMMAEETGRKNISLAFIGEGSTSLGLFHETLNLAAVLNLPFILVIENNSWAYSTPTELQYTCEELSRRAEGYGIPGVTIDGTDVELVYQTVLTAAERARKGDGPTLIETKTMRLDGHSAADMAEYVPKELKEEWEAKHPVKLYSQKLSKLGYLRDDSQLRARIQEEIDEAVEYALSRPLPEPETAVDDVYAP